MVWLLGEVGIFIYIQVLKNISFMFLKMKNSIKQLMKKLFPVCLILTVYLTRAQWL